MSQYSLKPMAQNESWFQLLSMKSKLPQSLLCIGPSGVGKKRSIIGLFQSINCKNTTSDEEPCGECNQCKKIFENNHPDLITISATGDQIHVEDLREMKKTLNFAPFESKYRFVIIDEAHKLNTNSANSILKILEEPPAHTRFFLTTHERNLILPTILSRSQFIYFSPLSDDALLILLNKLNIQIPKKHESVVLKLLSGGLSRAQWLLQEENIEFLDKLTKLPCSPDQISAFSDSIANDDEKIKCLIDYYIIKSHNQIQNPDYIYNKINDALLYQTRLSRNANKKLISYLATELYT